MKTLIVACMLATLFTVSTAYAFEWPTAPQTVKGIEGPDSN
jgi:hypothetical protein